MKISSTVQFREAYKSIQESAHISVRGEFICLITERRCQALALLITVRCMNGRRARIAQDKREDKVISRLLFNGMLPQVDLVESIRPYASIQNSFHKKTSGGRLHSSN